MKFIGIDLGWTSGPTGLACLQWDGQELQLLDLTRKQPLEEILAWLDTWVQTQEVALVAVDAPTLIPNATGTRLPDRLTHKHFGRYHAGCYPANLGRPFAQRTVSFGLSLEERGFRHAATMEPQKPGRYQIEVFPHPAMVNLFGLTRILKYKKGNVAQKRVELAKLQDYIVTVLPKLEPRLNCGRGVCEVGAKGPSPLQPRKGLLAPTINEARGQALKAIEDQLDGLICAYIGAYWWYWGKERNMVLGDESTGYIVVPMAQS